MSAVMTYTSLFAQLQTWMERTGDTQYIEQIDNVIAQTEVMISREYKGLGTQVSLTGLMTPGAPGAVMDKPARWRETVYFGYGQGATRDVAGNKRVQLQKRIYDYCRSYWPNPSVVDPLFPPKYYADYEFDHILIVPSPIVAYPFELISYQRPQPLDITNSTNWFTQNAPDLLFKGCILWASRYLRSDMDTKYQTDYDRALMSSMGEDTRRLIDAGQDAKEGT